MSSVEPPASAGHSQQRLATMEEETKKDGEGGGAVFLTGMRAAAIGPAKDIESGGGGGDVAPAAEVYDEMGNNDRPTPVVSVFTILKIATALSALYMCTNPWFFFYDADKGEICPYTVICATTPLELTLLTLSRMSAGVLYGSLTISIMSKCYATRSFLHHSWLGAVLDLEPSHDVHTYFGYLTLAAGFEHGILHCIRFSVANQAWIITGTDTGRSGVVACILLLPIVLPMKFDWFKKRMSFQFRKNLHMLFLALLVALCFHSVHFRYVGSFLLIWYTLDRFYFTTNQTFLITRPVFEAVGRGTMVGLDLPEGYTFKAGSYIYVNSPTISRSEWHPFSIIQVPGKTPKAAFYAEAVGDWTKELFRLGLGQPRLPLWITAAQPSLMEKSIYYDNLVLVCTGAGITPAVSIIERFAKRKNIHLIWITRDSGMVALFEKQLRKVNSTVHLTGKQSDQTKDALRRLLDPPCSQEHNNASNASNGSFLSILNTDSFFRPASGGPSRPRLGSRDEDQAMRSAFAGSSAHSANHVVFADDYPHPRRMPTATSRSPRLPGGYNATPEGRNRVKIGSGEVGGGGPHEGSRPSRTERVSSAMSSSGRSSMRPAASPVQVVFGRPDIGKYLGETFASKTAVDDVNAAATAGSSDGKRGRRPRAGSDDRDELDASQKKSKAALMRANSEMTRSTGTSSRNNRFHSSSKKSSKAVTCEPGSRASGISSSCPNPWLVLYCGANPKVEEAIAKTCDDLRVEWKKEYFGAW